MAPKLVKAAAAKKQAAKALPQDDSDVQVKVLLGTKPLVIIPTQPKTPAEAADTLYRTRAIRYAVQKVVEDLEEAEGVCREYIIETLPKSNASGITGRLAQAKIEVKNKLRVADWPKFYAYMLKSKRGDLLQKRISDPAVQEILDSGKKVPGVEVFPHKTVSCTKK